MAKYEQPLHEQLVDLLREKITHGLQPHDRLPSERELSKQYQVSRNTVRMALDELEMMGYIYRQHGRGTFVANRLANPTDLTTTYSFSDQMRAMGRVPHTDIVYLKLMEAPKFLVEKMHVPLGAPVYKLKRIRWADDVAMMVERTFLPAAVFPQLTTARLTNHSLYHLMQTDYNVAIQRANEAFYAGIISAKDAHRLGVPSGSPGLNVQRTTYDTQDRVVEYTLSVSRGDQFVYQVHHVNPGIAVRHPATND
ncbi:GntR family transcriptional regulator [Schleiferilactobacillus harbinensis]|jgi:GntR family transcriptional regulator|uniref:GntR family transcriptional regulator n=1 Tax=Schleiferilactobacillus harbinensis TaxID=304207 RepID=UPI000E81337C|nr:GntR family transcriptional regulator [Lactobacillus sp.]